MDKPSLKAALHILAVRQRSGEYHPTPEELTAYRVRELSSAAEDRIQEHLALCEDCARLLLDLGEFERFTPAAESIGPVNARTEAAWQGIRLRFGEDDGEVAPEMEADDEVVAAMPSAVLRNPHSVPFWRNPVLPWALAAGFALCSIGLWLRMGSLGHQLEGLTGPRMVRVVTLESEDYSIRGSDKKNSIHAGESVTYDLILSFAPGTPTYPLYKVEFFPAAGNVTPITAGRQPAHERTLRVVLRPAPEEGDYFFEVFGIDGKREISVGRYPFTILPPGVLQE